MLTATLRSGWSVNAGTPLFSKLGAVIWLVVLFLLVADNAAYGQSSGSATGRVTGTVALATSLSDRKAPPRLYTGYGPASSTSAAAADTNERLNVVIYVELAAGTSPGVAPHGDPPAIRQRDEAFLPHTLPVLRGSTVDFPNDDPFFHNVFSLSRARSFDLGRYARGKSKSVTFTKPGIVQVFCHIHAGMSAAVLVLDNPFFAVPDGEGRFAIDGIPAGDHRIVAWHERTGPVTWELRVRRGEEAVVNFRLPEKAPSGAR